MTELDLDDLPALEAGDPAGMLRAVASGAAQVREAAAFAVEAGLGALAGQDLPRSVVVLGMGGSGIAGDLLAAVAGTSCPVPVLSVKGHVLPVWVGAADLVLVVSCSGTTEETLSAGEEAVRRGCRMLVVAAPGSPAAALAARARAPHVTVTPGRQPRASAFALATPLVIAGHELGLLSCSPEEVESTAVLLEQLAQRYGPTADAALNPAKGLALALAGRLPVVWGSSPLAGVAAYRLACQLNENSKLPAVWGVLPEAGHNQVVALDGPFAAGTDDDLFRDRVEDDGAGERTRLHLVLLRDSEELPAVGRRADVVARLARDRGVGVTELRAEGTSAFQRVASLVSVGDWASAYLALLDGVDPTPVHAIDELKDATRR